MKSRVAFNRFNRNEANKKRQHGRCVLVPKLVSPPPPFFFFFFLIRVHGTRPPPPFRRSLVSSAKTISLKTPAPSSPWKTRGAHPANDARMETLRIDAIKTRSFFRIIWIDQIENRSYFSRNLSLGSRFSKEEIKVKFEKKVKLITFPTKSPSSHATIIFRIIRFHRRIPLYFLSNLSRRAKRVV